MKNWSRKTWIWIFAIITVAILAFLFFVLKGKAQGKNGNGNGETGTSTDCCGTISNCNSLSKSEVEDLQKELNNKNCTDYENKTLVVDGECGPRTNSAINKCKNK